MHVTYSATFTVWFVNQEALEAAKRVTGWSDWDRLSLEMRFHEDMLVANDQNGTRSYFGDWSSKFRNLNLPPLQREGARL